ncbi:PREDICTED: mucin-19-like [Rhagoletis zephyria]|uniref:mucin-19-like n=1 Tax=Rhagoletis zephyria TaxID=28612 RepID=UPI0008114385|nr:PREDICTED: mucin-19-like [Rhagoletis zephyria]
MLGMVETANLSSVNTTTSDQYPVPTTGITGLNTTTPGTPNATEQIGSTSGNTTIVEGVDDFVGLTNQSSLISASGETNIPGLAESADLSSANTYYENAVSTTGISGLNTSTILGSPNATQQIGLTSGTTSLVDGSNDFVGLTNQSSVINASNETNMLGLTEAADLSSAPTTGLTGLNTTTPGRPNATQQIGSASGNTTLVEGSNDFVGLTNQSSEINDSNETNILGLAETADLSSAPTTGLTALNTTTPERPSAIQQTGLINQNSVFNASNETNFLGLVETPDLSSVNTTTSEQYPAPTTGITVLNTSTTLGSPNATQQIGLTSGTTILGEESNDFVGLTNESSVFNASANLNSVNITTSGQYHALTTGITGLNTSTPGRPNATQQTGNLTVVEGSNDFVGLTNHSTIQWD